MPNTYDIAHSCYVSALPNVCSGSTIINGAYVNDANYNIGKLNANIPGYDPTNKDLEAYNFQPVDVAKTWTPSIYTIVSSKITAIKSGSVISSGEITSGATVCPTDSYNTKVNPHTLVSWYWTIISAGSSSNSV